MVFFLSWLRIIYVFLSYSAVNSKGVSKEEKDFVPRIYLKRTLGQKLADEVALKAGSWSFIFWFLVFLVVWILLNNVVIVFGIWDPYPFILLNLFLSTIAAIQAPIILMSQNRAAEFDRKRAAQDYYVNRKAEREIKILQRDILELKAIISNQPQLKEIENLEDEIKKIHSEIEMHEFNFK